MLTKCDPLPYHSDEYYLTGLTKSADDCYELIQKGRILPAAVNPRSGWISRAKAKNLLTAPYWSNLKNRMALPESQIDESYNPSDAGLESVLLDGKDLLDTIGGESLRQIHYLHLHSAYEGTSLRGEPIFTQSLLRPSNFADIKCADYIFFSGLSLIVHNTLILPRLSRIEGDDLGEDHFPYREHGSPPERVKKYFNKEFGVSPDMDDASMKRVLADRLTEYDEDWDKFLAGRWTQFPARNEQRKAFLPMHSSGSCHLLLCADIRLNSKYVAVRWPLR